MLLIQRFHGGSLGVAALGDQLLRLLLGGGHGFDLCGDLGDLPLQLPDLPLGGAGLALQGSQLLFGIFVFLLRLFFLLGQGFLRFIGKRRKRTKQAGCQQKGQHTRHESFLHRLRPLKK